MSTPIAASEHDTLTHTSTTTPTTSPCPERPGTAEPCTRAEHAHHGRSTTMAELFCPMRASRGRMDRLALIVGSCRTPKPPRRRPVALRHAPPSSPCCRGRRSAPTDHMETRSPALSPWMPSPCPHGSVEALSAQPSHQGAPTPSLAAGESSALAEHRWRNRGRSLPSPRAPGARCTAQPVPAWTRSTVDLPAVHGPALLSPPWTVPMNQSPLVAHWEPKCAVWYHSQRDTCPGQPGPNPAPSRPTKAQSRPNLVGC